MTAGRRILAVGLLGLGLAGCFRKPDPIQQEAQSVRDRTVPEGARMTSVDPLRRDDQRARESWTIEIDMTWDRYAEWVTSQLAEYRPRRPEATTLVLTRQTGGDVFAVTLTVRSGSSPLTVEASFEATAF